MIIKRTFLCFIFFVLNFSFSSQSISIIGNCLQAQCPDSISVSITSFSNTSCYGISNGNAAATITLGSVPYTYSWNGGNTITTYNTIISRDSLAPGTTSVTVTDSNGCITSAMVFITQPALLFAVDYDMANVNNGNPDIGKATVCVNGGTAPYSYLWNDNNSQTTQTATQLIVGTYMATVTDVQGCSTSATVSIIQGGSLLLGMTTYGGRQNDGAIISFNPFTNEESEKWSFHRSGGDGDDPRGALVYNPDYRLYYGMTYTGGTYSWGTIISFNPYNNAENVLWSFGSGSDGENPMGSLVYDSTNGLYYGNTFIGGNNGAGSIISFNPSDNTETLLWSFGDPGDGGYPRGSLVYDAINGLFYGMTLYGGNNDSGAIISFNPADNSERVVCSFNGTNGATPYRSIFYDPNNGLYYGMTAYGGSNHDGTIFSFNPSNDSEQVVWNFGGAGDGNTPYSSFVYNPNDGLFYAMTLYGGTNGDGTIISFNTSNDSEKVLCNFNGANGANPFDDLVYDADNGLFYGMTETGGNNNYGTIFSFSTSGGENVIWSYGGKNDGSGPYNDNFILTPPCNLTMIDSVYANVTCYGGNNGIASVSVNYGTSPYTYQWNSGLTATTNNTEITNLLLTSGIATITITDAGACNAKSSITLTQPGAITITFTQTPEICNGESTGTLSSSVSGGTLPYSYTWSNQATVASITGLSSGAYTLTITDANNCNAMNRITLTQPGAINISITQSPAICSGESNGLLASSVSGGTAPYIYNWSNGATGATLTGLSSGAYNLTVTDDNGCTVTYSANVAQRYQLVATNTKIVNIPCFGENNGEVRVVASGGTTPYSYIWSNNFTNAFNTNLTAGSYSVLITDARGCMVTATAIITQPASAIYDSIVSYTNVTCLYAANGCASAGANGGTPPYAFYWSNGASSTQVCNLNAGQYQCRVTDANGCTNVVNLTISHPGALNVKLSRANITCYNDSNGSIAAVAGGGTSPYKYKWSTNSGLARINSLPPNCYSVTVTDANGCTTTASTSITQPPLLYDSIVSITCVNSIGKIVAGTKGGTPNYSYLWTPGGGTRASLSGLINGNYTVAVTDSKSCTATVSASISCAAVKDNHDNSAGDEAFCEQNNESQKIELFPNPNRGVFNIQWTVGSGQWLAGTQYVGSSIEIYNVLGQRVYSASELINSASGEKVNSSIQINLSNQPDGVYILWIFNNNGQSFECKKFVKE